MKGSTKKIAIGIISSFVFIFLYEWLLHGKLLMGMYDATSSVWRPESEMGQYHHFMFLRQIGMAIFLTIIFGKGHENKGLGEGVRFGLIVGGLIAVLDLGTVCYLPIPVKLGFAWAIGSLVEVTGIGLILASICKK